MIVEKPRCPDCNYSIDNSNIIHPIYLKKTEDGWKCPRCNLEFYEKDMVEEPTDSESKTITEAEWKTFSNEEKNKMVKMAKNITE